MIPIDLSDLDFRPARDSDINEIAALVNRSYRGDTGRLGWTTESDLLGGQRIDSSLLKETLSRSDSVVLVVSQNSDSALKSLLACVHLELQKPRNCYLGMLTVDPVMQGSGLGKLLLKQAEAFAIEKWQATSITMTVIDVRKELIAWYKRHGYSETGESRPFPYGDERYGIPLRNDLKFSVLQKNIASVSSFPAK